MSACHLRPATVGTLDLHHGWPPAAASYGPQVLEGAVQHQADGGGVQGAVGRGASHALGQCGGEQIG